MLATKAAVTTADAFSTSCAQEARQEGQSQAKHLRSLASVGGVSQRTLVKQLNYIRDHPEVRLRLHARVCAYAIRRARLQPRPGSGTHTCSAPFNQQLACASQVVEAASSRTTLQRVTNVLSEAHGDNIEPEADWATLSLQDALPYLCEKSSKFKAALAEIARSQGRRVAHHPHACNCKGAVTTAQVYVVLL